MNLGLRSFQEKITRRHVIQFDFKKYDLQLYSKSPHVTGSDLWSKLPEHICFF